MWKTLKRQLNMIDKIVLKRFFLSIAIPTSQRKFEMHPHFMRVVIPDYAIAEITESIIKIESGRNKGSR
jgi:hypothetical protein